MSTIILSQKIINNLYKINDTSNDILQSLCKYILQMIQSNQSNVSMDKLSKYEDILASIATLLFEAARIQANLDQFKMTLQDIGLDKEYMDILYILYEQHYETFIQHANHISIDFPAIVGMEWRLDYKVRSKHGGRENIPLFLISLQVKDRGLIRYVDMSATQQELEDLLGKVRDAVKQVERVTKS